MGQDIGHGGYRCRRQQDQQHGILQLLHEPLKQGQLLRLLQAILPVLPKALLRLLRRKALPVCPQTLQHLFLCLGVFLLHPTTPSSGVLPHLHFTHPA